MAYRRHHSEDMSRPIATPGPVLFWESDQGSAIVFSCPCGEREVYVKSPPHGIAFDAEERLTIHGSVASTGHSHRSRDIGRCHFHIADGEASMCDDATCPSGPKGAS